MTEQEKDEFLRSIPASSSERRMIVRELVEKADAIICKEIRDGKYMHLVGIPISTIKYEVASRNLKEIVKMIESMNW